MSGLQALEERVKPVFLGETCASRALQLIPLYGKMGLC